MKTSSSAERWSLRLTMELTMGNLRRTSILSREGEGIVVLLCSVMLRKQGLSTKLYWTIELRWLKCRLNKFSPVTIGSLLQLTPSLCCCSIFCSQICLFCLSYTGAAKMKHWCITMKRMLCSSSAWAPSGSWGKVQILWCTSTVQWKLAARETTPPAVLRGVWKTTAKGGGVAWFWIVLHRRLLLLDQCIKRMLPQQQMVRVIELECARTRLSKCVRVRMLSERVHECLALA